MVDIAINHLFKVNLKTLLKQWSITIFYLLFRYVLQVMRNVNFGTFHRLKWNFIYFYFK
jgi:hypothetical protein